MTATLNELGAAGADDGTPPSWRHPLAACLDAVTEAMAEVRDASCWSPTDAELRDLVDRAHQVTAGVEELRLRLVAEADRRAELGAPARLGGHATTTSWLTGRQRLTRRAAGRDVRVARRLDSTYEQTRAALAGGRVNGEQAGVIVSALDRLPADVDAAQRQAAEAWLVEQAATFGPDELRGLGRRVFEVIDPDTADAREGEALQRDEQDALAKAKFRMRPLGDGRTRGTFTIPDAQAAMLQAALDALTSPRRRSLTPQGEPGVLDRDAVDTLRAGGDIVDREPADPALDPARKLPWDVRLGQAFCELIEHLPAEVLPRSGRGNATVVLTMGIDQLRHGLGVATTSTGTPISAAQVRRLACLAGIIPMVLGGDSTPLDLGRTSRFFTIHQRIALAQVQGGCVADGCDRPPAMCEAHHLRPWVPDGETNLADGVLLCSFHHHLVHDHGWAVTLAADGIPEMVPPAGIDPDRRPIRHRRFRRRRQE